MQIQAFIEKYGGFIGRETKISSTQLSQLVLAAQSRKKQGRVRPSGDDYVQFIGQVFKQKRDYVMDLLNVNQMIIIKNKGDVCLDAHNIIDQGYQNGFDSWRLR